MKKSLFVTLYALVFVSLMVSADLTDYIVVVKPVFHETTQATFKKLAQRLEQDGYADLASFFSNLAGEHGHGTGWVFVDKNGENYIFTNRHVVNQAERVNIYFLNPDGSQVTYNDCPILYVDDRFDLAVCQFPKKSRKFKKAFEVNAAQQKDLAEVVAAGYPGFGGEPVWQIAKGNVSNSRVKFNKNYEYLIQHTAPIDPGNSGGPLLAPDKKAAFGYKVIGVNTWKAGGREATNFAIPVKDVLATLEKAKDSQKLVLDQEERRARLLRECRILASEVSSKFPDYSRVYRFISYSMVGEHGFDALATVMDGMSDKDKKEWTAMFIDDPVETMRLALFYSFWWDIKNRMNADAALDFKEINFTDSEEFKSKSEIRTKFTVMDTTREIVWAVEQGHWRVKSFEMPKAEKKAAASTEAKNTRPAKTNALLEKGEFRDDFDEAKLAAGWEWVRENGARWNLLEKRGEALGIAIEKGDLYKSANNARNILLRKPELKDFTIHTKIDFISNLAFHHCGLIVYLDDDNYLMVYSGRHGADPSASFSRVGIVTESDGEVKNSTLSYNSVPMELWIVKKGDTYAGYAGNDGKGFEKIGEFSNPLGEMPKVGIFAYSGNDERNIPYPRTVAVFHDFAIDGKVPVPIVDLEARIAEARKKPNPFIIQEEFVPVTSERQLPVPAPGEIREVFADSQLDSNWTWLNENKSKWSLKDRPGELRIDPEKGDLYKDSNNTRNVLLRDLKAKDYTIEAKLEFAPSQNFQQAGLVVYLDDDNYVLVFVGSHPEDNTNRMANPAMKTGIVSESKRKVKLKTFTIFDKNMYLRIVKKGDTYTGYAGSEQKGYHKIGELTNKLGGTPRVGIFACHGIDGTNTTIYSRTPAFFDYFRIIPSEE